MEDGTPHMPAAYQAATEVVPLVAAAAAAAEPLPPPPGPGSIPASPLHSPASSPAQQHAQAQPFSPSGQRARSNVHAQRPVYGLHMHHGGEQCRLPAFGDAEEVAVAGDIKQLWSALQEGECHLVGSCWVLFCTVTR